MMRPTAVISTVIVKATSYDLAKIADIKTLFNITDTASDAALALMITRASAAAQNYCNNAFVVETIKDQFYPGSDGFPWTVKYDFDLLQLTRWPVVTISSLVETIGGVVTTLVEGTDFIDDSSLGQLTRLNTYAGAPATPYEPTVWRSNPVTVQYTAGFSPIPLDVADAVEIIVKGKYYGQTRDPMLRSENVPGVLSAAWFAVDGNGMPYEAVSKLSQYRVPVIA